jgi:hypothetical protein
MQSSQERLDKIAPTSRFRQRLRRKMPLKIAKQMKERWR